MTYSVMAASSLPLKYYYHCGSLNAFSPKYAEFKIISFLYMQHLILSKIPSNTFFLSKRTLFLNKLCSQTTLSHEQLFIWILYCGNRHFGMKRLYRLNILCGNKYLHVSLACLALTLFFINKYILVINVQFNLYSLVLYFNTFRPFCWILIARILT